jgi:DNA-binding beta-propeller fold protein YncE
MTISDRFRGKKNVNGQPRIESVAPSAALPGGEVRIVGTGFCPPDLRRPRVQFGEADAPIVISADDFVVARVPLGAASGGVVVSTNGHSSNAHPLHVAALIAENLHPVTNPALDAEGNIYATFSGSRGQKVPVSIFKIDTSYNVKPFLTEMMNATSIAFDRAGQMYVSSRYDGTVYRAAPNGTMSSYAEGMGVATGIAFDKAENLYVGDRSGTIFKIARDRQIFVFATIEPSVSAYHLAFSPHGDLFVTGPTPSSFDAVYKIDSHGAVSVFYRGLGRPQGMAFDREGNLHVAASLGGKRGIVRITPDAKASLAIAGPGLVGLAFAAGRSAILASTSAVYHLAWDTVGQPLIDLS